MFQTHNSPLTGLASIILLLVIIGIVLGLALSGSDIFNFITNRAKAEAMAHQTDLQTRMENIKIDALQEAERQKLLFQEQKAAQDLEIAPLFSYLGIFTGAFLAFCIGTGALILFIQVGRSRLIVAKAQVEQINIQQNIDLRKEAIKLARQREQMARASYVRQTQRASVPTTDQEAPILWEDLRQQFANKKKANPFSTMGGGDPEIVNVK